MGCGPGESTLQIASALGGFDQVVGVDIDVRLGRLLSAIADANSTPSRFACASCLELPFPPSSASVVVSLEMIEHVPGWRDYLREAARALEPGGLLLVSTPNPLAIHSMLKRPYAKLRRFAALNRAYRRAGDFYEQFLSERALRQATADAGLVVVEVARGGHTFTFASDRAFSVNLVLEEALEGRGILASLAVTTFLVARKPLVGSAETTAPPSPSSASR